MKAIEETSGPEEREAVSAGFTASVLARACAATT